MNDEQQEHRGRYSKPRTERLVTIAHDDYIMDYMESETKLMLRIVTLRDSLTGMNELPAFNSVYAHVNLAAHKPMDLLKAWCTHGTKRQADFHTELGIKNGTVKPPAEGADQNTSQSDESLTDDNITDIFERPATTDVASQPTNFPIGIKAQPKSEIRFNEVADVQAERQSKEVVWRLHKENFCIRYTRYNLAVSKLSGVYVKTFYDINNPEKRFEIGETDLCWWPGLQEPHRVLESLITYYKSTGEIR